MKKHLKRLARSIASVVNPGVTATFPTRQARRQFAREMVRLVDAPKLTRRERRDMQLASARVIARSIKA